MLIFMVRLCLNSVAAHMYIRVCEFRFVRQLVGGQPDR